MTVTPPEADTAQERETAALEAAIVLAVTAALAKALSDITSWLRGEWAKGDGPGWLAAKKTAASRLRALRVNLGPALERSLPKAAALGAAHADSPLPDGHDPLVDPLVRETIDGIDAAVRAKLARAADHLVREPVHTDTQVDDAIGRIDAARGEAEAQVGAAVTRTHAEGLVAAAEEAGMGLAWQAERDSCGSCLSMSGAVREGGLFKPVKVYPQRPIPWMAAGVTSPPLHAHCRCSIRPNTAGLAEGLAREAARSVARGWSAYDSLPARLQALDRVLRDTRLPKTVRARAAQDKARGRFARGPLPGTRPTRPTGSRTRSKAA